jgi:hypothetical protein
MASIVTLKRASEAAFVGVWYWKRTKDIGDINVERGEDVEEGKECLGRTEWEELAFGFWHRWAVLTAGNDG